MSDKSYTKAALTSNSFLSHVITITSETGVGSSTTLTALQKKLGPLLWRFLSGGAMMRAFAEECGMTIEAFAAYNREHPEKGYDAKLDGLVRQYGRQNRTVIEGRLTHVFVPHAFHVRLTCPIEIRAGRRQADLKKPLADVIREMVERDANDNVRYEKLYPGCLWSDADFDLVLDTSAHTTAEIVEHIVEAHAAWSNDGRRVFSWASF